MYYLHTTYDTVIAVQPERIVTEPLEDDYLTVLKYLHQMDSKMDIDDNETVCQEGISEIKCGSTSQLKVHVGISNTSKNDHSSLFEKVLAMPNSDSSTTNTHVNVTEKGCSINANAAQDYDLTIDVTPCNSFNNNSSLKVAEDTDSLVNRPSAAISQDGSLFQIKYPTVDILQNSKTQLHSLSAEKPQDDNAPLTNTGTVNILEDLRVNFPSVEVLKNDCNFKYKIPPEVNLQDHKGLEVKSTPGDAQVCPSNAQVKYPFIEISQNNIASVNNPSFVVSQEGTASSMNPPLEDSCDLFSSIGKSSVKFLEFVTYIDGIGKTNETENDNGLNKVLVDKTLALEQGNAESPEPIDALEVSGIKDENGLTILKPPTYKDHKYGKVELYAPDTGPKIYFVKGNIVTPPIITKNLPEAFRALPVHGKPESKSGLDNFYRQKIRDYVGFGISDQEFLKLEDFCSPEYLKTGNELAVTYSFPAQGSLPTDLGAVMQEKGPGENLCIVKKLKLRMKKDRQNHYPRKLKYRGLRLLPLTQEDEDQSRDSPDLPADEGPEGPLEPGRDMIFRVRFYRPHSYGSNEPKPNRHSVFNNDIVLLGRQNLTVLRDRIGCPNDIGMRVDISDNPDTFSSESAKRLFPSGFLFINNVFYVDGRAGCSDLSAGVRAWARRRRLGTFPVRDMAAARLDRVLLRLGHPEVYTHQGKCEHLFTFSEVRLLGAGDPLRGALYPRHSAVSQNQSVYCTTCAEFAARWIVLGCERVPFDPAFFCETCFKLYLYDENGRKLGDFKAYSFRGNTINFLKPVSGNPEAEPATDGARGDEEGDA